MPAGVPPIVVMGVQGCGKSTIGRLLAQHLDVPFVDGDDLHPPQSRAKMAAGLPLEDADRMPWLLDVGKRLTDAPDGVVVACSALRRSYRDILRTQAPGVVFVYLRGTRDLIAARVATRTHEFMPSTLLDTQFATLEEPADDERSITLDVTQNPDRIVDEICRRLSPFADSRG